MVTDIKPEQSEKASSPILVTLSGIVTEVSLSIPLHKYAGICSTASPKVNEVI